MINNSQMKTFIWTLVIFVCLVARSVLSIMILDSTTAILTLPDGTDLSGITVSSGVVSVQNTTVVVGTSTGAITYIGKCSGGGPFTNAIEFINVTVVVAASPSTNIALIDVDMSCDTGSTLQVSAVVMMAPTAGPRVSAGIRVRDLLPSTCVQHTIEGNVGGVAPDDPLLEIGLELNAPAPGFSDPAVWKAWNPAIYGRPYDVAVTPTAIGNPDGDCGLTCRLVCGNCLVDPTRFPGVSAWDSGVCYGVTQFASLAAAAPLCTRILVFPVEYPQAPTQFLQSPLVVEAWDSGLPLGPHASTPLLALPKILHGHASSGHSIDVVSTNATIRGLHFVIEDSYLPPFYGAVLFTSTGSGPIDLLEIRDCVLETQHILTFALDVTTVASRVESYTFVNNNVSGVGIGLAPDVTTNLVFVNNTIVGDSYAGLLDVSARESLVFSGNAAHGVGRFTTPDCFASVCISNTHGTVMIRDNWINGTTLEPSAILHAAYQLRNVTATLADITGNSNAGTMVGVDFADVIGLPCSVASMFLLKQGNADLYGHDAAIKCDYGLPSELSCSGVCVPVAPPPAYCEVSNGFVVSTLGWMISRFPTLSSAVSGCEAGPVQVIYVHSGSSIVEASGIVFELPLITQVSMEIRRSGPVGSPNPVILGQGHTIPQGQNLDLIIDSVDFRAVSMGPSLMSGYVGRLRIQGAVFSGLFVDTAPPTGGNTPIVSTLMDLKMDYDAWEVSIEDSILQGATVMLLRVEDDVDEPPTPVLLSNVRLRMAWVGAVELVEAWIVTMEHIECVEWCGGLAASDAIVKVGLRSADPGSAAFVVIHNVTLSGDSTLAPEVPGGIGYRAGLWMQQPSYWPTGGVGSFYVRNVTSVGYPVAARIVEVNEGVLALNELSPPLVSDTKRDMRELARRNAFNGTIYDVKRGEPEMDDVMHPINTCNELCIPLEGPSCEVSAFYNPSTADWGTLRFASVQTAIHDCAIPGDPVRVVITIPYALTSVEHVESVVFNVSSRSVHLAGAVPDTVSLVGQHVVDASQAWQLTLADLTLVVDDSVPDRTLPVVDVGALISVTMRDIRVSIGTSTTPYNGSVIRAPATVISDFLRVHTGTGIRGTATAPLFHLGTVTKLVMNYVTTSVSAGSAIVAELAGTVVMDDCTFSLCSSDGAYACVRLVVVLDGSMHMVDNSLVVVGDGSTGLWLEWQEVVDDVTVTSVPLAGVVGWSMSGPLLVGIRLPNVTFTPAALLLPQLDQKAFVRDISTSNDGIDTASLYDVVIGVDDTAVAADPHSVERLWCSDGCPPPSVGNILLYVLGGIIIAVVGLIVCALVGPTLVGKTSPVASLAIAEGRRRATRRIKRRKEQRAFARGFTA